MSKKKDKIYVIVKKHYDSVGVIKEVKNDLPTLRKLVGGNIERVPLTTDLVIICDEEGRLKKKPWNCRILGADLVGTIVVAGVNGDEFDDCPVDLVDWQRYWLGRKR